MPISLKQTPATIVEESRDVYTLSMVLGANCERTPIGGVQYKSNTTEGPEIRVKGIGRSYHPSSEEQRIRGRDVLIEEEIPGRRVRLTITHPE